MAPVPWLSLEELGTWGGCQSRSRASAHQSRTCTLDDSITQEKVSRGVTIMNIQNILVPVDYSDNSCQALQWGASLAEKYGARLLLLHVMPAAVEEVYPQGAPSMRPAPYDYEVSGPGVWIRHPLILEFEEEAQAELHAFARRACKESVPVQVKVTVGKPAEEILRVAREERVDLIVMGTHGRTGVRHLLLGSVAEAIARYAPCPVCMVRIGGEVAP
jgi:nucleotide-binding universal stress UspA family protein